VLSTNPDRSLRECILPVHPPRSRKSLQARPLFNFGFRVRHEVADGAVLLSAERTGSTCCSASSILPGSAAHVIVYVSCGFRAFLHTQHAPER
jgi:hypothetical protein